MMSFTTIATATTAFLFPTLLPSLLLLTTPVVHALDPDCTLPNGNPYNGYALKTGTGCTQYVNCQNGMINGWLSCAGGLLYSGNVAEGGTCKYPADVQCADAAAAGAGGDAAAASAPPPLVDEDCALPPDTPDTAPLYTGFALKSGTQCKQYIYCTSGLITSWHTCPSELEYSGKVAEPGICNFPADVQCADPASDEAMASASDQTTDQPTVQPMASSEGATPASSATTSNPKNYFCGTSVADAEQICVPCPSSFMVECTSNQHGCFMGIDSCAGAGAGAGAGGSSSSGGGSDNSGASSGASAQSYVSVPVPAPEQTLPAASEPAPAPAPVPELTLPPWTNAPFNPSPTNTDKTVIGYYASWQWYDREKFADPQNIDFSKYDRINYAFFQPDVDGNLYGTDEWGDPQLLWGPFVMDPSQQSMSGPNANYFCSWDLPLETGRSCAYHDTSKGLINLVHAAGVEIMPSIGGWTLSDNFPGIAASAAKRENFAEQCVELILAYGFDGIDIDWEYPGYEDHSGTPEDTINFTLFLQAIRDELDGLGDNRFGEPYGLTAALPCGPDKIEKIQVNQIKDILTELNLMSYDMHGAWDDLTGTNAPMFDQGWTDETPRWSVHGCVNNYMELGVPLSKMNIGLPFYGRSFKDATGMKQLHGGADDINYHLDEGSPQYFNIVNELSRMTTYRHDNTQTQYATFNTGGGLVSYDDPRAICDKVAYANERGMHGFLIWEISGDMIDTGNGNMATPLTDAMNNKIQDPNFDCSTLRDPLWALSDNTYRYAPDEPDTVDRSNYVAPQGSSGSANDFNGAPGLNDSHNTAANHVYVPPSNTEANSPANSGNNPSDSDDCPLGLTGYAASSDCTKFMYCMNGSLVGAMRPCSPGTLYSVGIGGCTYAETVVC